MSIPAIEGDGIPAIDQIIKRFEMCISKIFHMNIISYSSACPPWRLAIGVVAAAVEDVVAHAAASRASRAGRVSSGTGSNRIPAFAAPSASRRSSPMWTAASAATPSDASARSKMTGAGFAELDALVEVIEPIGSEVILIVTAGGHQFTAKVHPQTKARLHQSIKLAIDANKVHLFDKETGEKIDL